MRKLLLASWLLLAGTLTQAQQLTGCMGLQFGDSKETVSAKMRAKPEFKFYKVSPETNSISYTDGSFAGHPCVGTVYHFYDNQLYNIVALLDPGLKTKCIYLYNTVVEELQTKYGIEPKQIHTFRSPYSAGDGYELSAIKLGYADINSYFYFDSDNVINVSITESLSVRVQYQHAGLATNASNEYNKKRSTDY